MSERTYKYLVIFVFFTLLLGSKSSLAQYQYSIDLKERKDRRVSVKFWIGEKKDLLTQTHDWRKNKRIEEKDSKKIRKHAYKIQKSYVKKRMKKSRENAECYNKNKIPFYVKFKSWLNG